MAFSAASSSDQRRPHNELTPHLLAARAKIELWLQPHLIIITTPPLHARSPHDLPLLTRPYNTPLRCIDTWAIHCCYACHPLPPLSSSSIVPRPLLRITACPPIHILPTPPMSRRSARIPAQPSRLADEQESHRIHAQELAELREAIQQSLAPEVTSESDEEEPPEDESTEVGEEEKDQENIPPALQWAEHTHEVKVEPFTDLCSSNLPRRRVHSEFGYLQCFLPHTSHSLISTIATNTNLYASFKEAPAGWATTPKEVWMFIAVHIYMGIIDLPYLHMYWEGEYRQPYVVHAFSRNRFTELLRYFHIAKPTPKGTHRSVVQKIAPHYDRCLAAFPYYCTPPIMLTMDESMVRFKGRSPWKTLVRGKPTPTGYKFFTLASHGYLLTFDIFRGRAEERKKGYIHQLVLQMTKPWYYKQHVLFTDNYFTSPALCRDLLTRGVRSCGTFHLGGKSKDDFPKGFTQAVEAMRVGDVKAWQDGDLGLLAWFDSRPVQMLAAHQQVDVMVDVQLGWGPSQPPFVTKPQIVLDYNVGKCGVDTVDQLRASYAMQRRSVKNWPSIAWWLIDICIINSFTLWRLDTKANISQLDFRRALLHQIPVAFPPHSMHAISVPSHSPYITADGHWPKHCLLPRECVQCPTGRLQGKRTRIECEGCGVRLCVTPCFKLYHVAQERGS